MIPFGQQILHWKLFQISSYVTWTDGIRMALTCQAAVTRHAEEPGLEPCSEQAGRSIPWASRHAWDNINCTLAQLPMFTTQEQIPQDRETGTHSPGQTSGKFGWIVKINKSLLWEQSLSGNVIPEERIRFGNSWNVTGKWILSWLYSNYALGLEHKGAKWLKIPIFTELAIQWGRKTSNQAIKQTNNKWTNTRQW